MIDFLSPFQECKIISEVSSHTQEGVRVVCPTSTGQGVGRPLPPPLHPQHPGPAHRHRVLPDGSHLGDSVVAVMLMVQMFTCPGCTSLLCPPVE